MAHNIEIRENVASFVAANEPAWHGLGKVFDGLLTTEEALHACHADYDVDKRPLFTVTPELEQKIINDEYISTAELKEYLIKSHNATMRLDHNEVLGIVSKDYGVVQNKDAFKFIDILTGGNLMPGNNPCIESAGVLGGGERIFITAKFPEPMRLANKDNDILDMYIVFTTSHDGTGAVRCMMTPVRVVCQNTLNLAMQTTEHSASWRHSKYVEKRLDLESGDNMQKALKILGAYDEYQKYFNESMLALEKVKVNDKIIEQLLAKVIMSPKTYKEFEKAKFDLKDFTKARNVINGITDTLHTGVGQNMLEAGTGLWLINGLTCHYQNTLTYKSHEHKFHAINDVDGGTYKKLNDLTKELLTLG